MDTIRVELFAERIGDSMRLVASFLFILCYLLSFGQTMTDALRFGQQGLGGSARFTAMSGSMGALGGDASAVAVNPGGLGIFRKGQGIATISYDYTSNMVDHYGTSTQATDDKGRLGNFAVVLTSPFDYSNWKYGSVIFGYRNKDSYEERFEAKGVDTESSYLDQYFTDIIDEPNLYLEDIPVYFPFGAGLAWNSFLIDTAFGQYYHVNPYYGQTQSRATNNRRGMSEYYLGFGANYEDRLYLGATLGFTSVNVLSESTYKEEMIPNSPFGLVEWSQYDRLQIKGSGSYAKLGLIYWVKETIRVGLAFNTREKLRLTENYYSSINAEWDFRDETFSESPDGYNEYIFRTPYRVIGSLALVRIKRGSVNADVEYVDYRSMKFEASPEFGTDYSKANNEIQSTFGPSVNLRIGGELMYGPLFFRGGTAYWGNPYKNGNHHDKYRVSTGLGWRKSYFFVDLSYGYEWYSDWKVPIHYANNVTLAPSTVDSKRHLVSLSFGIKFQE